MIIGVRVLVEEPSNSGIFCTKYEFSGIGWKTMAISVLSNLIEQNQIKIQTLHSFSTSYNLYTGDKKTIGELWLDNPYFKLDDLY
jgi:hypothetical protein